MALKTNKLAKGENLSLEKQGKNAMYRAIIGGFSVTNTFATTFVAGGTWATAVNIATLAAAAARGTNSAYNNILDQAKKPKFRFEPKFLGVYVSDMGDNKAKSIILEHAHLELKVKETRYVNEPLIMLPTDVGIDRRTVSSVSNTTLVSERLDGELKPFKMNEGIVLNEDQIVDVEITIEAAALTTLAALAGSTPTQGWYIAAVIYGNAFLKGSLSI